ncbi:MAG: hypothetical protein ACRES8_06050 [Nevskiaceae bacterium]
MARTAGKKQAPAKIEEDDDSDSWDDAVVETDDKDAGADLRLRDWRDVERFREMKELRRLVDDDYGLEEIFHVPLKPRTQVPPRTPKLVIPVRPVIPVKTPAKPAPAKHPASAAAKPHKKPAAKPAKPKPRVKAKAKRR